ncbi:putrescine transport ATP-binding protein PotA [Desulfocucumis palustris]|uniref:Spermidine/putrescine import ATP-binding protein PotA n=1 Tax=Desulfocucumis palustris TaxID=1898651 RepID=A0A2L2X7C3_9FIRM|nr:ABC transporter ATP-binding protein [Desulfocucumis palustris]GBF31862.1 putrescine transport ATP-binding protein PotA [Desulfocucumis palustris]
MGDNMVQLINISKNYGDNIAVDSVSIDIKRGEFITLLGPSGCGKTTTLRLIAGFEQPTGGAVLLDGEPVEGKQPHQRNVNTVFQNYALFPHMNVSDNIAFGLRMKKTPREQIKQKVSEMLSLVQLEGYGGRMPDQLSGGQKQRIAIARALINNPKVLLLDEPLGALDLKLRKQMQLELKHLQQKLGITFVYVTHDQEEALTMSDRIAVMNRGRLEQLGYPFDIYEKPETRFVADFIGETNLYQGKVSQVSDSIALVDLNGSVVHVARNELVCGETVWLAIRPERIKISFWPEEGKAAVRGRFKERIYVGSVLKTVLKLDNGMEMTVSEQALQPFIFDPDSDQVFVNWEPEDAVVMRS